MALPEDVAPFSFARTCGIRMPRPTWADTAFRLVTWTLQRRRAPRTEN